MWRLLAAIMNDIALRSVGDFSLVFGEKISGIPAAPVI